jgi:flagellum-specific peptidoglycan hydrolase FlgJ
MAEFPQEVIAAARKSQDEWDVPCSVVLAQWALESGWGQHVPPDSNNPFGIKAGRNQPHVSVETWEVIRRKRVKVLAMFRKFATIADAFDAHAMLLATAKAYRRAMAADTAEDFADALTGVYASDPHYGEKLRRIMDENDLYQYDVDGG